MLRSGSLFCAAIGGAWWNWKTRWPWKPVGYYPLTAVARVGSSPTALIASHLMRARQVGPAPYKLTVRGSIPRGSNGRSWAQDTTHYGAASLTANLVNSHAHLPIIPVARVLSLSSLACQALFPGHPRQCCAFYARFPVYPAVASVAQVRANTLRLLHRALCTLRPWSELPGSLNRVDGRPAGACLRGDAPVALAQG